MLSKLHSIRKLIIQQHKENESRFSGSECEKNRIIGNKWIKVFAVQCDSVRSNSIETKTTVSAFIRKTMELLRHYQWQAREEIKKNEQRCHIRFLWFFELTQLPSRFFFCTFIHGICLVACSVHCDVHFLLIQSQNEPKLVNNELFMRKSKTRSLQLLINHTHIPYTWKYRERKRLLLHT